MAIASDVATVDSPQWPGRRARVDEIRPGQVLGRYELGSIVGKGGMGVVYRATDSVLGRVVALKILATVGQERDRARARAKLEAQALASLSHPNVVPIYDIGYEEDLLYISMEYVEGANIRDWLRGEPTTDQILDCFVAAAAGLAAAHEHSIVHRDFKPTNALVGADGRVRVLDFGIARLLGDWSKDIGSGPTGPDSEPRPDVTQPGVVLGTPRYMSPEQYTGRRLGPASDQYSFCLALCEALNHKFPFSGKGRGLALQKVRYQGTKTHGPLAGIQAVLDRGLRPDASKRFATMRELIEAIEAARPRNKGRRWLPWAAAVAVALGLGGVASATRAPSRCESGRERGELAWNEAALARANEALARQSHPLAAETAALVSDRTRAFGEAWLDAFDESCSAWESGKNEPSSAVLHCLEGQRARVQAMLKSLATDPDSSTIVAAPELFARLPTPQSCADRPEKGGAAASSERERELTAELAAAQTWVARGRYDEGVARFREILSEASDEGLDAVEADALLHLAQAISRSSDFGAAANYAEQSYFKALEASDETLALRATASVLRYVADADPNSVEVARWEAIAESLLDRAGAAGTGEHADLLESLGALSQARGHVTEAEKHYRASLALSQKLEEPPYQVGIRLLNLASALLQQRDETEGVALLLEAKAAVEAGAGPNAEALGTVLANLCSASDNLGRHEEAIGHCLDALGRVERLHGPGTSRGTMVKLTLAQAYRNAGRVDEAVTVSTEARDEFVHAKGRMHRDSAVAEVYLGSALEASGDLDGAIAAYKRATAVTQDVLGDGNLVYATALSSLGSAQREAGLYEASEISLREVIRTQPLAVVGPNQFATLHVDLARSLLEAGRPEQALATIDIVSAHLSSAAPEVRGDAAFTRAKAHRSLDPQSADAAREAMAAIQHYSSVGGRFKESAAEVRAWLVAI